MSITYATSNITAIQDGDAITAAILNGPSVSLATRTDEVLRNSKYDDFIREYTSNCLTKLTPTLEGVDPTVTLKTTVQSVDGTPTGTFRRYYSVSLNGAALSVYSESGTGGRYIIPGSSLGSYFSDSSEHILSNYLVTPGDGIYLKVPLRYTGVSESANNYPDMIGPKNQVESLTNQYVTTTGVLNLPTLVKLPMLTEVTLLGETKEDLLVLIKNNFATVSTISVDSNDDTLSLVNASNDVLSLRLNGVQGAVCEITHMRTSGSNCILTVVAATGPIFRNTDTANPSPTAGLAFSVFKGVDEQDTATSTPLNSVTGYLIIPKDLDPTYRYIPIVRLTESSLEVGDRSFNLIANYDYTNGNIPLLNLNGSPSGASPTAADSGEKEHVVYLLDKDPVITEGLYTIKMPIPEIAVNNQLTSLLTDSESLLLSKIKSKIIAGSTLSIVSARYTPISNITTSGSLANLELHFICTTTGIGNSSITFSNNVGAPQNYNNTLIDTSANSLVAYGSIVELYPEADSTPSVTGSAGLTALSIRATISESAAANMLSGKFYIEVDLLVS